MYTNIKDFDFKEVVKVLKRGGVILYPTDTIWGIGCDATNSKAVDKVFRIKGRDADKSLIILAENFDMIKDYVAEIPDVAHDLVKNIKEPLTVIFENAKNLGKNVAAEDGSVAIRIPKDEFCLQLLNKFGNPITSTSANVSGAPNPLYFSKIDDEIKNAVDYVVPYKQHILSSLKTSTIIRITENKEIKVLRS